MIHLRAKPLASVNSLHIKPQPQQPVGIMQGVAGGAHIDAVVIRWRRR